MTQEERIKSIVDYLGSHMRIGMDEICTLYQVSYDTARRDLVRMEQEGLIVRIRGGAMLPAASKHIKNYKDRLEHAESKRAIARMAASLIQDGEDLILDTGTTTQYTAEFLKSRNNVVVTNSIDIAAVLCDKPEVSTHLLGGELNTWHRYAFGPRAIEMLADIKVDKLFLGACGITPEGVFATTVEEAYMKREMIKRSNQVILLADASKFNKSMFHRVCAFEQIDMVITDEEPAEPFRSVFKESGITLMFTSETERPVN